MRRPSLLRRSFALTLTITLTLSPGLAFAQAPAAAPAAAPAPKALQPWVVKSNEHAKVWLEAQAKMSPEGAGQMGVEGLDEQITDLSPGFRERADTLIKGAQTTLQARLAAETDPQVKQDLAIMVADIGDTLDGIAINRTHFLPYFNVAGSVFGGLRSLLDDQVAPQRRQAALVRLKKYAGIGQPAGSFAKLAEADTRSRMNDTGLLFPSKAAVERSLADSASFVDGIPALFDKYGVKGYEADFAQLKTQLSAYGTFVRETILPKARTDFRLPPEVYARNLRQYGVDIPPPQLTKMAHEAFDAIQAEMKALAPRGREGEGLDRHRLSRRHQGAEEAAARRRGDPAALPGAPEGPRGDHHPREARDAAVAAGAHPARLTGRDRGVAGAEHAAAAPRRQHRRAGRVRAAAERPGRPTAPRSRRRLHLRGGVVDADRARSATGP